MVIVREVAYWLKGLTLKLSPLGQDVCVKKNLELKRPGSWARGTAKHNGHQT